ncbi:MAG TPA: GAF domain-containing protein [Thermoanaerobaculia bacterium]
MTEKETYVLRIWEETKRATRDLLEENRSLRALMAQLQEDRGRLSEELRLAEASGTELAAVQARALEAEAVAEHAAARVEFLERQLDGFRRRREELETRLATLEEESRERLASFIDLEQQNTNLANLYVASYRLHSTLDRNEVLAGILEIIINLVGSEELVVFEMRNGEPIPHVAASFGLPFHSFCEFPFETQSAILHCLERGEIAVDGEDPSGRRPTACIPLGVDGRAVGAIAVFRLLQQKQGIEGIDRELFDLLATHAATALYATGLHAAATMEVA